LQELLQENSVENPDFCLFYPARKKKQAARSLANSLIFLKNTKVRMGELLA